MICGCAVKRGSLCAAVGPQEEFRTQAARPAAGDATAADLQESENAFRCGERVKISAARWRSLSATQRAELLAAAHLQPRHWESGGSKYWNYCHLLCGQCCRQVDIDRVGRLQAWCAVCGRWTSACGLLCAWEVDFVTVKSNDVRRVLCGQCCRQRRRLGLQVDRVCVSTDHKRQIDAKELQHYARLSEHTNARHALKARASLMVSLRRLTLAHAAHAGLLDMETLALPLVGQHMLGRAWHFPTLDITRRFNAQGWAFRQHQAAMRALNARLVPLVRRGGMALAAGNCTGALRLFEKALAQYREEGRDRPKLAMKIITVAAAMERGQ